MIKELFKKELISEELITSLDTIQKKRAALLAVIEITGETLRQCDEKFWGLVYTAHPDFNNYYVNIDLKNKVIHAELEK